jgi:hypothetical protein
LPRESDEEGPENSRNGSMVQGRITGNAAVFGGTSHDGGTCDRRDDYD